MAQDIQRLFQVRAAVGETIELRFDANQGYDEADTLRFVEAVRPVRLELLRAAPRPVPKSAFWGGSPGR